MQIDIITLFPKMFTGPFEESIVKRALDKGLLKINLHNLRNWAIDKRGTVDGRPYGGGVGMLLHPEPIFKAVEKILKTAKATGDSPGRDPDDAQLADLGSEHRREGKARQDPSPLCILLDPGGKLYNQEMARRLAKIEHIILICGHYEGVDYRVHEHLADEVVSIGDYILTGGEIPAMVLVDSLTRLIPGVFTKEEATKSESFSSSNIAISPARRPVRQSFSVGGSLVADAPKPLWRRRGEGEQYRNISPKAKLLEFPQYTRPENFRGLKVPKILLSGNHAEIEKWRKKEALKRTRQFRPDLLSLKK